MRSALGRVGLGCRPAVVGQHSCCHSSLTLPIGLEQRQQRQQSHVLDSNSDRLAAASPARHYSTKLAEVGRFEDRLTDESCYPAGQLFLHRLFGYRGVILFPWLARVYDVDLRKQYSHTSGTPKSDPNPYNKDKDSFYSPASHQMTATQSPSPASSPTDASSSSSSSSDESDGDLSQDELRISFKSVKSNPNRARFTNPQSTKFHPYYQVLIDTRDCPYVSRRTQTEAVTFLGHPDNSKSVYSIKGLDYVAHDDILPYTSYEEQPIHHELHKKLFRYDTGTSDANSSSGTKYVPSDLLDSWRNKHPWLDLSRVYKETTEDVRVTVIPFYLGHTTIENTSFHWWRYCVRLENLSDISVYLRERHWKIFSQTNMLQTIKGRGVVGVEPLLTKSEPSYQYSSHVNLQDKSGHMWGTYKMQREDGYTFECRIPPFSLESSLEPNPTTTINS